MWGFHCKRIEVDEIWTFVRKKERHLTDMDRQSYLEVGDQFVFVAISKKHWQDEVGH